MARLGGRQGRGDGVGVPDLPDQDDVRVLPHGGAQGPGEVLGVDPKLPLIHAGHPVGMQDLDGILEGQDVDRLRGVDVLDHRCEGCRLAGAGRPGDQDQPARKLGKLPHHRWQAELLEGGTADRDGAKDEARRSPLTEGVHPEPADPGH